MSVTLLDKPLFGPAHMHMQQPTKSHFIGDLSPQSNPLHYLSSIGSLHEWYWDHSGTNKDGETVRPPLVINTHGWIKVCVCWETDAMLYHFCHAVSCCAVLCCAVLCCAVLCCAVLCWLTADRQWLSHQIIQLCNLSKKAAFSHQQLLQSCILWYTICHSGCCAA